jgi:hypothetical protein
MEITVAELYFENEATKRRYKVVKFDREAGTVTLIGQHNKPFTEKFSKERFQAMGYQLKQEVAQAPTA